MKKAVSLNLVSRIFNLGNVNLITTSYGGNSNISTVAWITPIEKDPPLVLISLDRNSYSFQLLEKSGEFALNTPTSDLLEVTKFVGSKSGKDEDKILKSGLTFEIGKVTKVFVVKECIANVEFFVRSIVPLEKHAMVIGIARFAQVEEELFSDHWLLEKFDISLVNHAGSNYFCTTKFLVEMKANS